MNDSTPATAAEATKDEAPVTDHSDELVPMIIGVKRGSRELLDAVKLGLADSMGTTDEATLLNKIFETGLAILGSAYDRSTTAYLPATQAPKIGLILGERLEDSAIMLVDFLLASTKARHDTLIGSIGMAQTVDRFPVMAFYMRQSDGDTECSVNGHRTISADAKQVFGGWTVAPSDRGDIDAAESPLPSVYSDL